MVRPVGSLLYFANYCYVIRVCDMNDKFLTVFLATMLPGLSFGQGAQNYQCSYGDLQRRVEILYETGVTVPCEVHYYKDTEAPGESQVLWRALNESGYCERKTEEFIAKLQEMGWNCRQDDDAGQDAEPEQADNSADDAAPEQVDDSAQDDDTEALTPSEDAESTEE